MMESTFLISHIFYHVFPYLVDDKDGVIHITDYTGMPTGVVNYYSVEYDSDDNLRFVARLYTKESLNKKKIEAYTYKLIDDSDDEWEIDHDHCVVAEEAFDNLSKNIFHSEQEHFHMAISNDENTGDVACVNCGIEFIDVSHERSNTLSDIFYCPVCNTKLGIHREIKTVYTFIKQ